MPERVNTKALATKGKGKYIIIVEQGDVPTSVVKIVDEHESLHVLLRGTRQKVDSAAFAVVEEVRSGVPHCIVGN